MFYPILLLVTQWAKKACAVVQSFFFQLQRVPSSQSRYSGAHTVTRDDDFDQVQEAVGCTPRVCSWQIAFFFTIINYCRDYIPHSTRSAPSVYEPRFLGTMSSFVRHKLCSFNFTTQSVDNKTTPDMRFLVCACLCDVVTRQERDSVFCVSF